VRLKPYLRRLELSLSRLGSVLEQAKTVILLHTSINNLSFSRYASTTLFEGALCAFETVFAPSWNVFEPSLKRLGASKNINFAVYIYRTYVYASTTPVEGASCAFETVFALSWSVFEPSWTVVKASWSKQKQWFCYTHLSKICLSTYMLQQHLLKAPSVRLKSHLRRLEVSLSRLESSWRLLGASKTMILLHTSIKNLSFNLYASTTSFAGALFTCETIFAACWSVFALLEPVWRRPGASKNNDFTTYLFQNSVFQLIYFNNTFWRRLLCVWTHICAVLNCLWPVLSRLEASWSKQKQWFCYILSRLKPSWRRLGARNMDFAVYIYQKSGFQIICFNTICWRCRVRVWSRMWAVLKCF